MLGSATQRLIPFRQLARTNVLYRRSEFLVAWRGCLLCLVLAIIVFGCASHPPSNGTDSDTGTHNVTYYVEVLGSDEVNSLREPNGNFPFLDYDFNAPVAEFAKKTLYEANNVSRIYQNSIQLVNTGEGQRWVTGLFFNRDEDSRWGLIAGKVQSTSRPLLILQVAPYDHSKSAFDEYKFPETRQFTPVAGEQRATWGPEDDVGCGATTEYTFEDEPTFSTAIIYVGTMLKYCVDISAYIKSLEGKAQWNVDALQDYSWIVNHGVAHEMAHHFGITDEGDLTHTSPEAPCVMNEIAFTGEIVKLLLTRENETSIESWYKFVVFSRLVNVNHGHFRDCSYDDLVAHYDSTHTQ